MKKIIIAVLLLFVGAAQAQTAEPSNAVHDFRTTILRDAYTFAGHADTAAGVDDASSAQKDLDRLLPAAIDAAHGHADLTVAIKTFYIAAKTYFDSALTPVPLPTFDPVTYDSRPAPEAIQLKATQARLKADLDSRANAMQLEAKLAGVMD
jgi:hypothetical protein